MIRCAIILNISIYYLLHMATWTTDLWSPKTKTSAADMGVKGSSANESNKERGKKKGS